MSRSANTARGSNHGHNGAEIWSRRPTRYVMAPAHGPAAKRVKRDTHRAERRQAVAAVDEALAGSGLELTGIGTYDADADEFLAWRF